MDDLLPMVVVGIIFGTLVMIVKTLSDNRVRKSLIESGQIDEKAKYLYLNARKREMDPLSSVKWGMVMIGVGLALLIGQFINQYTYHGGPEGITIGLMFLFAGIAFLIYYRMKKNQPDRSEPDMNE